LSNKKRRKRSNNDKNISKRPQKKLPLKKLGGVIGLFALSTALYYAFASAGYGIVYPAYVLLAAVLFVTYFAMNRGLMSIPTKDRLSDSMTEEEKDEFLAEVKATKKRTEPILYLFIAVLLTILCDSLYSQFADGPLGELMSKLTGGSK
jgi:uncharacterized membrane protein